MRVLMSDDTTDRDICIVDDLSKTSDCNQQETSNHYLVLLNSVTYANMRICVYNMQINVCIGWGN